MNLVLALTALQKGGALLVFTGVAAPLIGLLLKRVSGGWETMGGGPFAILNERPRKSTASGAQTIDPAIQAAEVRLLAAAEQPRGEEAMDAELRAEVRQLVVVRNERRLREGLEPLDVEAEIERQLADFIGSN